MPIIRTGTDHKSYSQPALLNDLEMRPRRNANWQTVDIEGFSQKKRNLCDCSQIQVLINVDPTILYHFA